MPVISGSGVLARRMPAEIGIQSVIPFGVFRPAVVVEERRGGRGTGGGDDHWADLRGLMSIIRLAAVCGWGVLVAASPSGAAAMAPQQETRVAAVPASESVASLRQNQQQAPDQPAQQPDHDKTKGKDDKEKKEKKKSPWMVVPLAATSPKMGTSVGGMGAFLHYFDPKSQVSMFGGMYQYSTTHSQDGALFARTSFSADRQRLEGFVGFGYVRNEYEDYMGTGTTLETTDDIRMAAGRYLFRVKGNWFAVAQGAFANYLVSGLTPTDQAILDSLGIIGFDSGGIGPAVMHDSRDNQDMPEKGWYSNAGFIANREALGAEADFVTYRVYTRMFLGHGNGHVFAVRQDNQFTDHAPASAEATVMLRGYKAEQYLARYTSSIEAEERVRFSRRWGMTVFLGFGWLYGGSISGTDSDGVYPSFGAGLHFVLLPEDHMLVNLEYARGKDDNYGLYLKFGYSW
jgi:hypothetical protein